MKWAFSLLTIAVLLINANQSLAAQEGTVSGKLFYIELLGPGVLMSANLNSRFHSNVRTGLGYSIGIGLGVDKFENRFKKFWNDDSPNFSHFTKDARPVYSFPIGLNYVLGKPNRASAFEFGAGVTLLSRKVSLFNYEIVKPGHVIGFLNFMYRLTPVNGGVSVRVGFTPIIGTGGDLYPMGAIGFGYAF